MYYQELNNFPKNVLTDQYQRPNLADHKITYRNVRLEFFKREIIDLFLSCNLELKDGEIFKKNPGMTGAVHTDVMWDTLQSAWVPWHCAININLDHTNSLMYWILTTDTKVYPTMESNKLRGIHYGTRNNNKFQDDDKYSILDSFCIIGPTLVRTDVPHSVKNLDNKERWCLSLRFKGNPTFEECADKLINVHGKNYVR
jgi:hypothetical protein